MHEINYDRHEHVYAYQSIGTNLPLQPFDAHSYDDYIWNYISASALIHTAADHVEVDFAPGYLIKDNTKCIHAEIIEPFCLCGDRTRLVISDNFKSCFEIQTES
jgi:hypothetical protein